MSLNQSQSKPLSEASAMNTTSKSTHLIFAASAAVALLVTGAGSWCCTANAAVRPARWTVVKVELPVSNASFPPGPGADIANAQCLICHSAGMVLRQPPLTQKEWLGEINKMRTAFGAPLPADQVEPLAKYLQSINDGQRLRDPSAAE
jgi:mono/diheme cytochrome c family protein